MTNQVALDIIGTLRNNNTIHGIVGLRIYRSAVPQGAILPYVVIHSIGGSEQQTHSTPWGDAGVLEREIVVQVDAVASQIDAAASLYGHLKSAFEALPFEVRTTVFHSVLEENPFDEAQHAGAGQSNTASSSYICRSTGDFRITYSIKQQ